MRLRTGCRRGRGECVDELLDTVGEVIWVRWVFWWGLSSAFPYSTVVGPGALSMWKRELVRRV